MVNIGRGRKNTAEDALKILSAPEQSAAKNITTKEQVTELLAKGGGSFLVLLTALSMLLSVVGDDRQ